MSFKVLAFADSDLFECLKRILPLDDVYADLPQWIFQCQAEKGSLWSFLQHL